MTTNSKNNTSQVPSQVSSVINEENQGINVSNITDRSYPQSTSSTISKLKVKHVQRTALLAQQHRSNLSADQKHFINVTNHATKWYSVEKEKTALGKKRLSAEEVCRYINKTYKTNLHHKRIGNLVAKGFIGVTLPKQGVKGDIPTIVYKSLCEAFDSHIKTNQFNGNAEKLAESLNMVIGKKEYEKFYYKLLVCVLTSTGCNILGAKCHTN